MTQPPRQSGPDPIGDLQRWLVRSSARGVGNQVSGHLRAVLGQNERSGDVWERATTTESHEGPECAWCPVCRAARVLRESGPGVSSQVSAAGGALMGLLQDALAAAESALSRVGRSANPPGESSDEPDHWD